LLCKIYVDDIIFGGTNQEHNDLFSMLMTRMGVFEIFIQTSRRHIFISRKFHSRHAQEIQDGKTNIQIAKILHASY
jgi:hypothetical protein